MLALLCLAMSGTWGCMRVRIVSAGKSQDIHGSGGLYTPYNVVTAGGRELVIWSHGGVKQLQEDRFVTHYVTPAGLLDSVGYSCAVRTKRDSEGRRVLVGSPRRCRKVRQK